MASKKHRKTKKYFLVFVIFLFLVASLLYVNWLEKTRIFSNKTGNIIQQTSQQDWQLEIATTLEEQYKGLSNRSSLCPKCGMLFVFPDMKERSFVMRDMNFSLDIIFIRDDEIIKIYQNLEPEGNSPQIIYNSFEPVNYVLEINAGQAEILGLEEGSKITLSDLSQ
jgi:uncharacterized protein